MILLFLLCFFGLLTALEASHALLLKQFRVGLNSRECLVVGVSGGRLRRGSAAPFMRKQKNLFSACRTCENDTIINLTFSPANVRVAGQETGLLSV